MGTPGDIDRVGWFRDGAAPGDERGAVLLAGHKDSAKRGAGAFYPLDDARRGTRVEVRSDDGRTRRYRVVSVKRMRKADLPVSVFARTGKARLVLVTCGGPFDQRRRSLQGQHRRDRGAALEQREQQHDHDEHEQHGARGGGLPLVGPEAGVGPVAGVAPLGRGADPVVVVWPWGERTRVWCRDERQHRLGRRCGSRRGCSQRRAPASAAGRLDVLGPGKAQRRATARRPRARDEIRTGVRPAPPSGPLTFGPPPTLEPMRIALALILVALAGCGGDDPVAQRPAPTPSPTPAATPTPAPDPARPVPRTAAAVAADLAATQRAVREQVRAWRRGGDPGDRRRPAGARGARRPRGADPPRARPGPQARRGGAAAAPAAHPRRGARHDRGAPGARRAQRAAPRHQAAAHPDRAARARRRPVAPLRAGGAALRRAPRPCSPRST